MSTIALHLTGPLVSADTLFRELFDDGSIYDNSPVSWVPTVYTNGTYDLVGNDLQLRANVVGQPLVLLAAQPTLADVSIRTQLRVEGGSYGSSVFARFTQGVATYQAGIQTTGAAYIGWNDSTTQFHQLSSIQTDLRPTEEDVMVQFDAFGNSLLLYLWRPGEAKPLEPTIFTTSDQISSPGFVGLLSHLQTDGKTTFRFVEVADTSIEDPSSVCDFNGDGSCDTEDIDLLTRAGDLSAGVAAEGVDRRFDLNFDSVVDQADVAQWLSQAAMEAGYATPYLLGDTNLDGLVDFQDFVNLNNNWQQTSLVSGAGVAWSSGDFDGNGIVEFADFVAQNNHWQRALAAPSAVAVPEPSAMMLVVFAVSLCCCFRIPRNERHLSSVDLGTGPVDTPHVSR
jgi:hypothetical protein